MNGPVATDVKIDYQLIEAIQQGLPLVSRPYKAIGERIGIDEAEVIDRIRLLQDNGIIKRLGVIVRHHELGYNANAMVVWDVAAERVTEIGQCMSQFEFITLCYQRQRRMPDWPYNLYCMIHGQDRNAVLQQLDLLIERCGFQNLPHEVLFSERRFKQRGAHYLRNSSENRDVSGENNRYGCN